MIYILLAEGFEEIEAVSPIDLLRRAGCDVQTVSIEKNRTVNGAHGIPLTADILLDQLDFEKTEMLVLPGGWPGYENLGKSGAISALLKNASNAGKRIAAICGAPSVLGKLGLLQGVTATCYPGMEDALEGAVFSAEPVVVSGAFITARGAGCAAEFALTLVREAVSAEKAEEIRRGIVCL